MVKAPPRPEVLIGWMGYGSLTGARQFSRGRLWIIAASADEGAELSARIAWNHPSTGQVVHEDLGPLSALHLRGDAWAEAHLLNGQRVAIVTAPCVCGAGSVGYASPGPENPRVAYVSLLGHPAVTQR